MIVQNPGAVVVEGELITETSKVPRTGTAILLDPGVYITKTLVRTDGSPARTANLGELWKLPLFELNSAFLTLVNTKIGLIAIARRTFGDGAVSFVVGETYYFLESDYTPFHSSGWSMQTAASTQLPVEFVFTKPTPSVKLSHVRQNVRFYRQNRSTPLLDDFLLNPFSKAPQLAIEMDVDARGSTIVLIEWARRQHNLNAWFKENHPSLPESDYLKTLGVSYNVMYNERLSPVPGLEIAEEIINARVNGTPEPSIQNILEKLKVLEDENVYLNQAVLFALLNRFNISQYAYDIVLWVIYLV